MDTFYPGNADGSAVEQLADTRQYCCLARISPDHSRILTMTALKQTATIRKIHIRFGNLSPAVSCFIEAAGLDSELE